MTSRRRTPRQPKPKSTGQLVIMLFLAAVIFLISMNAEKLLPTESGVGAIADGEWVRLEVVDVGQADCLLLTSAQGEKLLIDAGNRGDEQLILEYLHDRNITRLDYVIATHPHEDHIGSMAAIIDNFEIGTFYAPDATNNTATFRAMIDALENKNVDIVEAYAGVKLPWKAGKMEFLAPKKGHNYKELNDSSAVLHLSFGETTFLFTGDAEAPSEREMLETYELNPVSVLKVGHHGSSTSSSEAFLQLLRPEIAVITCGTDNEYGHPHQETLNALREINTTICRTDLHGHLVLTSDGKEVKVASQKGGGS